MKYTNSKMVVDHTDKPNNFNFSIVKHGDGIDTIENVTLERVMQRVLNTHNEIRPAGGVEFWDVDGNMNGTLSPEFLDNLIKSIGGVKQ